MNKNKTTITSVHARYQTLIRCIQQISGPSLHLIHEIITSRLKSIKARDQTPTPDSIRDMLHVMRKDQLIYNMFYSSISNMFSHLNLTQLIQNLVQTVIQLSQIQPFVQNSDDEGNFVIEPIFNLYEFLLRICGERPSILLQFHQNFLAHVEFLNDSWDFFIAQQLHINPSQGLHHEKFMFTVTSTRARYQTLMRCFQQISSYLIYIIIFLIQLYDRENKIETNKNNLHQTLSKIKNSSSMYQIFDNNLKKAFGHINFEFLIELLVTLIIQLTNLELQVAEKDEDGNFVTKPILKLFYFCLQITGDYSDLLFDTEDANGKHVSFVQESLENFIAQQLRFKFQPFILPADV